jgi:predicted O-methyltransferase YrrM
MEQMPPNTVFSRGWAGYTTDWFSHRIPPWKRILVPVYKDKPTEWLEIGSYEGRSAIWTMANILTHPNSHICCIDPWTSTAVEKRFDENMKAALKHLKRGQGYVMKRKAFSENVLKTMERGSLDVIYVDGDHQGKSALQDAVLAWPLLKAGGFLIFDDYRWDYKDPADKKSKLPAREGIDAFLKLWASELIVVHKDYQVIVRKKS